MKKILLFLSLFSTLCFCAQQVKNVDALAFKKLVDENKATLIDLRTSEEIQKKGMIAGATQIDFLAKDAEAQIAKLDRSKPYLIYCAGGGRSADCGELMQKLGFVDVTNLEKGFTEWKAKGLAVANK